MKKLTIILLTLACLLGAALAQSAFPIQKVKAAAEKGDAKAQLYLGLCYEEGTEGVKSNLKEAVRWYRAAAVQGDRHAQLFLASCYEEGKGMIPNLKEAARWYRAAAVQGDVSARAILGKFYLFGKGVEKD